MLDIVYAWIAGHPLLAVTVAITIVCVLATQCMDLDTIAYEERVRDVMRAELDSYCAKYDADRDREDRDAGYWEYMRNHRTWTNEEYAYYRKRHWPPRWCDDE